MLSRGVPPQKETKPLLESSKQQQPFFGKNLRKQDDKTASNAPKEEEKNVKKKEEMPKKEEEKMAQKKEEPKKEDEQTVQKKGKQSKPEEEKVMNKLRRKQISEMKLRRKESNNGAKELPKGLEQKLLATKGSGFTLPDEIRNEMESKFKADFSQVKIHTDNEAATMADELGAAAFTHGNDIYFAQGKYSPQSIEGKKLLAHELTHVLQ